MIAFGTDGWRDIIGDGFEFAKAERVCQAVCDYVTSLGSAAPTLVIGHDTRFMAERFAALASEVAAGNGIKAYVAGSYAPTPAISYAVVAKGADGAILFTASHNPPAYQGLKFKASYGGSATSEITTKIEERLAQVDRVHRMPEDEAKTRGLIEAFDPKPAYLAYVTSFVDGAVFKGKTLPIVVDPMYGAGQGYLSEALAGLGCEVTEIHDLRDPLFGGLLPEPIESNLGDLKSAVAGAKAAAGFALDGDADRVGAVDADGSYLSSHDIFSLLLKHLARDRGMTGRVVHTVSTTRMVPRLAKTYGLTSLETPVGFKYICEQMLSGDVLIGGEESGGIGVAGYLPERDGTLISLLLAELIAATGRSLGDHLREVGDLVGRLYYSRRDVEIRPSEREAIRLGLPDLEPESIGGLTVESVTRLDGHKFNLHGGGWLMIRPSGTEAVVRIYAEGTEPGEPQGLIEEGERILDELKKERRVEVS